MWAGVRGLMTLADSHSLLTLGHRLSLYALCYFTWQSPNERASIKVRPSHRLSYKAPAFGKTNNGATRDNSAEGSTRGRRCACIAEQRLLTIGQNVNVLKVKLVHLTRRSRILNDISLRKPLFSTGQLSTSILRFATTNSNGFSS